MFYKIKLVVQNQLYLNKIRIKILNKYLMLKKFNKFYQVDGVCGNDPFALESGVDTELYSSLLFGEIVKLDNTSTTIKKISNFFFFINTTEYIPDTGATPRDDSISSISLP